MLSLANFDELFSENPDAVIANNTNFSIDNFAEAISKLVYSDNKTGDIGFVAECECGHLKGNYFIGRECNICKTVVDPVFIDNLRHKVWISTPKGIDSFIHPIVYFNVSNWLACRKRSYLDDLLDPSSKLPEDLQAVFKGRGFNYVKDNWDYIMNYFLNVHPKTKRKKQVPYMRMFLDYYKDVIFPTKLPILCNELHPITREGKSLKYTDDSSKDILTAIIDLATVEFSAITTMVSHSKMEKVTYNVYMSYISYITKIITQKLAVKKAMLRHHIFGTRLHGTFRSVIVPIMGEHYGDELHIPWNIGVNTYKLMLINVLINRRNYSMPAAMAKVQNALIRYDRDIDEIFQLLISECGYRKYNSAKQKYDWIDLKGLPVLFNRNPSLRHESIQLLYITKVKPCLSQYNPGDEVSIIDNTIGMSTLVLRGPNADFDGDALNALCLFEMGEVEKFHTLHPSTHIFSTQGPKVGTTISLAKQEILLINNWISDN